MMIVINSYYLNLSFCLICHLGQLGVDVCFYDKTKIPILEGMEIVNARSGQ